VRPIKRTALLVLLGGCLAAAGCGSDDEGAPIPAESAALLQNQLNSVESRINGSLGACDDVTEEPGDPNTTQVQRAIDGLPGDVDQDVRDALQGGFDRLFELVEQRCAELREEQTDTETTPETTPETDTETETDTTDTTDTLPTETEPTTPTDTTEEPTTPTVPENPSDGSEGTDGQGGGSLFEEGDG
jgi:hypothetical protein